MQQCSRTDCHNPVRPADMSVALAHSPTLTCTISGRGGLPTGCAGCCGGPAAELLSPDGGGLAAGKGGDGGLLAAAGCDGLGGAGDSMAVGGAALEEGGCVSGCDAGCERPRVGGGGGAARRERLEGWGAGTSGAAADGGGMGLEVEVGDGRGGPLRGATDGGGKGDDAGGDGTGRLGGGGSGSVAGLASGGEWLGGGEGGNVLAGKGLGDMS